MHREYLTECLALGGSLLLIILLTMFLETVVEHSSLIFLVIKAAFS